MYKQKYKISPPTKKYFKQKKMKYFFYTNKKAYNNPPSTFKSKSKCHLVITINNQS